MSSPGSMTTPSRIMKNSQRWTNSVIALSCSWQPAQPRARRGIDDSQLRVLPQQRGEGRRTRSERGEGFEHGLVLDDSKPGDMRAVGAHRQRGEIVRLVQ